MPLDKSRLICVDAAKIDDIIKEAYNLSRPQGMGYLHFKDGELPDDELQHIKETIRHQGTTYLSMDYILGRAVKLTIYQELSHFYIQNSWYDHSEDDLQELLNRIGVVP